MEAILQAIVLGIVQGLTEFLPVSSSGHLEIAKFLLGEEQMPEESLLMTILLHGATALSTVVVYRKDIWGLLRNSLRLQYTEEQRFLLKIVLSMVPAVIIGLLFEKQIEAFFSQNLLLVGICLVITGILLLLADRARHTGNKVGFLNAFLVGLAQAFAILPGISRSGSTISASVLLGIDRERAARFSFLMVLPLIFGKIAKDLMDGEITATTQAPAALVAGFFAAFLVGLLACTWMIRIVKNSKLSHFSYYCFAVAAFAVIASMAGA